MRYKWIVEFEADSQEDAEGQTKELEDLVPNVMHSVHGTILEDQ